MTKYNSWLEGIDSELLPLYPKKVVSLPLVTAAAWTASLVLFAVFRYSTKANLCKFIIGLKGREVTLPCSYRGKRFRHRVNNVIYKSFKILIQVRSQRKVSPP